MQMASVKIGTDTDYAVSRRGQRGVWLGLSPSCARGVERVKERLQWRARKHRT
jgi:hypothetical protein